VEAVFVKVQQVLHALISSLGTKPTLKRTRGIVV
jgi:hypothetical protein